MEMIFLLFTEEADAEADTKFPSLNLYIEMEPILC